MSELERIELTERAILEEMKESRRVQVALLASQAQIIVLLQAILREFEPATDYPASTGATITVT